MALYIFFLNKNITCHKTDGGEQIKKGVDRR